MPRKVTAYACEFKCGRTVSTKRAAIVAHEKRCICNPTRRTCRTCRHDELVPFENDTGYGGYNECLAGVDRGEASLLFDCTSWESR